MDDGPSGIAEVLATAMNTSLTGLERAGVVSARGGKTHLLARSELQANCDPVTDTRTPVWEVTQHLIKRLDEGGEGAAADLVRRVGGLADIARDLAYRLYAICEKRNWSSEGEAFNAHVTSWPGLTKLAAAEPTTTVSEPRFEL